MAIEIFYLFVVIIYLFPSRLLRLLLVLVLLPVTFNWFLCRAVGGVAITDVVGVLLFSCTVIEIFVIVVAVEHFKLFCTAHFGIFFRVWYIWICTGELRVYIGVCWFMFCSPVQLGFVNQIFVSQFFGLFLLVCFGNILTLMPLRGWLVVRKSVISTLYFVFYATLNKTNTRAQAHKPRVESSCNCGELAINK